MFIGILSFVELVYAIPIIAEPQFKQTKICDLKAEILSKRLFEHCETLDVFFSSSGGHWSPPLDSNRIIKNVLSPKSNKQTNIRILFTYL